MIGMMDFVEFIVVDDEAQEKVGDGKEALWRERGELPIEEGKCVSKGVSIYDLL
jgi:hypothetical protein